MPALWFPAHRPRALALASLAALTVLAGCGDAKQQAVAQDPTTAPATTTAETTPPATTVKAKTKTKKNATAKADDPNRPGDFSVPPEATGADLPKVPAKVGLTLSADGDAALQWSVVGKLERGGKQFCTTVHAKGPQQSTPTCELGTLMALQFFSDLSTGPAVGGVQQIAKDKASKPSALLVSGIARADVDRVNVLYAGKRYPAQVTQSAVSMPVNKQFAKTVTGDTQKKLDRLPETVTIRMFAVSMPMKAGAPPLTVRPGALRPIHGAVTLQLS